MKVNFKKKLRFDSENEAYGSMTFNNYYEFKRCDHPFYIKCSDYIPYCEEKCKNDSTRVANEEFQNCLS